MTARPARLGIDLGGTKIEAALLDGDGIVPWRKRLATPAGDYAATVAAIAALVANARARAGCDVSVGIGTPGTATAAGLMKNCNSTCLNGRPLQRDVEAAIGQPVRIANDADCLALSEATDGAGAGAALVFGVILGTGVGGGIAAHGRLLAGLHGLAGEWGHNPLPWAAADELAGPACWCGQRGCIETWLSGPALGREHARRHGGTLDAAAIAALAAAGDAAAAATLERHAERLARALAGVVNLLDPEVIVLGGGVSLMPHLYTQVPARWSRWVFGAAAEAVRTRLVPARHGDSSGVRGAAGLWR